MGKFRAWIEQEEMPQMSGRTSTPASDEVKRTGLQPQVDSQEIQTSQKEEQDKIMAIDAGIEKISSQLPDNEEKSSRVARFKRIWDKLRDKWDEIKMSEEEPDPMDGLGFETGQGKMMQAMKEPTQTTADGGKFPLGPSVYTA